MFMIARLSTDQVQSIQEFEDRERIRVLALKDVPVDPEPLDAEKLLALHDLEQRLDVCLLAVH